MLKTAIPTSLWQLSAPTAGSEQLGHMAAPQDTAWDSKKPSVSCHSGPGLASASQQGRADGSLSPHPHTAHQSAIPCVECTQLCWSRGSWRILCTDRALLASPRDTFHLSCWQRQCRCSLGPADLLQAGLSFHSSPGPRSHHPPAASDKPWTSPRSALSSASS